MNAKKKFTEMGHKVTHIDEYDNITEVSFKAPKTSLQALLDIEQVFDKVLDISHNNGEYRVIGRVR